MRNYQTPTVGPTSDVTPEAPATASGGYGNQHAAAQLEGGGLDPSGSGELEEFRGGGTWTVQAGDTLSSISMRTYGATRFWPEIRDANPGRVRRGGHLIIAGTELTLPVLSVPVSDEHYETVVEEMDTAAIDRFIDRSMAEEVALTCLPTDYEVFFTTLLVSDEEPRRSALLALRDQGEWEAFLGSLDETEVGMIQDWLPAQEGQDGNYTLEERIEQAQNSSRGRDALARVDAVAAADVNHSSPRITARLRELLALGVALPRLEGAENGGEGILSPVQAERAAMALTTMPSQEYARVVLLLTMTGSQSALEQSFLVLKATAARLDQWADADPTNDSLADIEAMADGIRDLDPETAVALTQVTGLRSSETGLQQQFTMSCAPTAGVVMRAEADPTLAYRLNTTGSTATTDLGGEVARVTEEVLERYGGSQVAVARDSSGVTSDVNTAIAELGTDLSAAQATAVTNYLSGLAFVQADYDAGIARVREHLDMNGHPNDQAMRLAREGVIGGNQPGMGAQEIADEYNNDAGLNVDATTGATYAADVDATLQGYRGTLPGGNYPATLPANIVNQVTALLNTAANRLEQGYDVGFGVLWNGSGGHAMAITNVDGSGASRTFLVHDSWSGTTQWVTTAQFQQANLPMGRGLIYRLARPD